MYNQSLTVIARHKFINIHIPGHMLRMTLSHDSHCGQFTGHVHVFVDQLFDRGSSGVWFSSCSDFVAEDHATSITS